YALACLKNDEADMAKQVEAAKRFPESFRIIQQQAAMSAFRGQFTRARAFAQQFEEEATSRTGLKGAAAQLWGNMAQLSAQVGETAEARAEMRHALALDRNVNTLFNAAVTLIVLGDVPEARRVIDEVRRQVPPSTSDNVARVFAQIDALARVRAGDKSALAAIPAPRDEHDIGTRTTIGFANLEYGSADTAAARFKEVMDDRRLTISTDVELAPLYYGRALVKLGRIDEARAAYERFFANWKNADPDIPLVVSAKQEYSKLQKS